MHPTELYFAYGSNMEPAQMRERCPESDLSWFIAEAKGWRLCFPRKSTNRKCGVASLTGQENQSVWGVVFSLTDRDLSRLDRFEGVPNQKYRRDWINVFDNHGHALRIHTYFAVSQDNPPKEYKPSKKYMALIIKGAEYFGLPTPYIEEIKRIETSD